MDYVQDFCLACDNQSNGPYCSKACRLADLERASPSTPTSLLSSQTSRRSWPSTTPSSVYVLAPAFDFSDKSSHESSPLEHQPQTCYFMRYPTQQSSDQAQGGRSLTPSSSRSSLSSTSSDPRATYQSGISQQARTELDGFFNSFSRAKSAKRRSSLR